MSLSRCSSDPREVSDTSLLQELRRNIGRVVTIFTASGGCSGNGFTGILTTANHNICRLVTTLPSMPRNPFGIQSAAVGAAATSGCHECRFGTACMIPLDQICAVVSNDI